MICSKSFRFQLANNCREPKRSEETNRCTSGARNSDRPTAISIQQTVVAIASPTARPRCVPVQQFETWLTGVVLAAAPGDRLRLDHRPRIRQVKTQNASENAERTSVQPLQDHDQWSFSEV